MPLAFAPLDADAIRLIATSPEGLAGQIAEMSPTEAAWLKTTGFTGGAGETAVIPAADGTIAFALVGTGTEKQRRRGRFLVASAASKLPAGTYRLEGIEDEEELNEAALGWLLETYRYDRYKKIDAPRARLCAPEGIDWPRIERIANAEAMTRELINTPPADMGPAELEAEVRDLASAYDATIEVISGEELEEQFPMIHAVGRAAAPHRAPRLIDMRWGEEGPLLTLVGKGVCFDTGGLDIKPASSMGLMKKDMGGAATVLGLAAMIMGEGMPLRLRVLIPAVENSVGSDSFRPQDVLVSRKGLTVEINNTDAEGRLVLADALAYGAEEEPELMISMATLTGAARVAVGPDLAPFFTDDVDDALDLVAAASAVRDPVWQMPFHEAYDSLIEPAIADLDNAPAGGFAGAITAALFLRRFASDRYMHFDIYGWQPTAAPARPKGGVGQGARALFEALPQMLDLYL